MLIIFCRNMIFQWQKNGISKRRQVILWILCAFTTFLLFQCKDDETHDCPATPTSEVVSSITANQTSVILPATEGNYEIKITSSGTNWTVKEAIPWLDANEVDNKILKITYVRNLEEERSGKVTASIEDQSIEITITQLRAPVTLSLTTYGIPAEANTAAEVDFGDEVNFGTGITHWWITGENGEAASNIEGIHSVSVDGSSNHKKQAIATKNFTIDVSQNPNTTQRTFALELHVGESTGTSQGAIAFILSQEVAIVSLSSATLTVPFHSGSNTDIALKVTNGTTWSSTTTYPSGTVAWIRTPAWITGIDPNNGTGTGSAETLTIDYETNAMNTERKATLTFTAGTATANLTVTQQGATSEATIVLNKSILGLFPSSGSNNTVNLTVTNGTTWNSTTTYPDGTPAWITGVHPNNGTGTGSAETLTIGYESNDLEYANREATLTFTAGTATAKLTVTQRASFTRRGLISVYTLEQLNAIRYDLNGDGKADNEDNHEVYTEAFPGIVYGFGRYIGYQLARNLDFNENDSYSDAATNKPKWSQGDGSGVGWNPIGRFRRQGRLPFVSTFDGKGHTISNLYINNPTEGGPSIGLFGGCEGTIRNVGLVNPSVTDDDGGSAQVGSLVGWQSGHDSTISNCYVSGGAINGGRSGSTGGLVGWGYYGTISFCYVSNSTITANKVLSKVGGLVGSQEGDHVISFCYVSEGTMIGAESSEVGGLVGRIYGTINACYVSGGTMTGGENSKVGGLGGSQSGGTIRNCYVSEGTMTGESEADVGSLIGEQQAGTINACYTGEMDYDNLVGDANGTVTNSYHQLASGGTEDATSKLAATLVAPTGYTGIYVNWNLDLNNDSNSDDPWDFGDTSDLPVLKINFNNDISISDDVARQRS